MNAKLRVVTRTEPIDLDRLARMQLCGVAAATSEECSACGSLRQLRTSASEGLPGTCRPNGRVGCPSPRASMLWRSPKRPACGFTCAAAARESPLPHATVTGIVSDHDSRLPMPGSILMKEHRGKTIVVRVLDSGFEYDGRRFASLSAIAKEITGTKWNGFLFFGLAKEYRGGR